MAIIGGIKAVLFPIIKFFTPILIIIFLYYLAEILKEKHEIAYNEYLIKFLQFSKRLIMKKYKITPDMKSGQSKPKDEQMGNFKSARLP